MPQSGLWRKVARASDGSEDAAEFETGLRGIPFGRRFFSSLDLESGAYAGSKIETVLQKDSDLPSPALDKSKAPRAASPDLRRHPQRCRTRGVVDTFC
jgi:hypothetical protein